MARRSKGQRIGSLGQNFVRFLISKNPSWISRMQDEDFGFDLEAELAEPEAQGDILKIQIKSTEKPDITPQGVKLVIETKYLRIADNLRIPLVLVLADTVGDRAWYLWLQGWLLAQRRIGCEVKSLGNTVTVYLPTADTLTSGLNGRLKIIARWADDTQLFLSLINTMRTAVATCNEQVLFSLAKLIGSVEAAFHNLPLELLIDILVKQSTRPCASWQLSMLGRFLALMACDYGDMITNTNVMRMVVPGTGVSRAGLNGLGSLYDTHGEHIRLLDLPNAFEAAAFPEAAFYCRLREKYPGVKAVDLAFGEYDYTVDRMTVIIEDKNTFLNKWANRGESAYLDHLVSTDTTTSSIE